MRYSRQLTQALISTQTLSQSENLELLEELFGCLKVVAFDIKAEHSRVAIALPLGQLGKQSKIEEGLLSLDIGFENSTSYSLINFLVLLL